MTGHQIASVVIWWLIGLSWVLGVWVCGVEIRLARARARRRDRLAEHWGRRWTDTQ